MLIFDQTVDILILKMRLQLKTQNFFKSLKGNNAEFCIVYIPYIGINRNDQ